MERLYGLYFVVFQQVSSHFSCLAECCDAVLLWSSINVLWTTKLSISMEVRRYRLFILEWTVTFQNDRNCAFNMLQYILLSLGKLFLKTSHHHWLLLGSDMQKQPSLGFSWQLHELLNCWSLNRDANTHTHTHTHTHTQVKSAIQPVKPHSLIFQAVLQLYTHRHTHTESSQMFSISAFGLCWGTRAIRGEFHAITVEQYTQQVSVHPTVARVLLNILTASLTACPETATRERRSRCLFQKAWHGSAWFSLVFICSLSLAC